jgi:hypothetical protein
MKDRISVQERAVRRLVEGHGVYPSRYSLAGRHHDAGSYVPDLRSVRDDDLNPTGKPCQTAFASSNTRLPLDPEASKCGFRMVAQANSFIGMTFPTAGLGRGCWIVKLRGRKRRRLQRPRGSVPESWPDARRDRTTCAGHTTTGSPPEMVYSGCERFLADLSTMQRAQKITLGEMRQSGGPSPAAAGCTLRWETGLWKVP